MLCLNASRQRGVAPRENCHSPARVRKMRVCGLRPPGPGSLTTAPGSSRPGAPVDTGPGVANTQGSAQLGLQVRSLACLVSAMQQDLTPTLVPCLHKRDSTGAGVFRDVNRTALFHRDILCGLPPQCQTAARCAGSFSHAAHKLAAAGRGPAGVLCFSVPSWSWSPLEDLREQFLLVDANGNSTHCRTSFKASQMHAESSLDLMSRTSYGNLALLRRRPDFQRGFDNVHRTFISRHSQKSFWMSSSSEYVTAVNRFLQNSSL